jgi:BirA family biotin operon repressor/biotin-[acetyl-CoA-carboxylase] ligase
MCLPFVRTLIERDEIASTNDLARELALGDESALPLVIRASRQTRGRGRGSNTWWSDDGSLTFTLLIDPRVHDLGIEHEPKLALAMAVAIVEAIDALDPHAPVGIRWPNDVEISGRKVGGILPERVETPLGPRLLVGVGLNVTTDLSQAPTRVRGMAVALHEVCARPVEARDLFHAILEAFGRVIVRLACHDAGLAARWDELDQLRGGWVKIDQGPRTVTGVGRGIDPDGALCLESNGELLRVFGGQVLRQSTSDP